MSLAHRCQAGDKGLYGRVLVKAVRDVPGTGGRVELLLDKVDLTDRLRVRTNGPGADEEQVRQALFDAYPRMETNTENGNLVLEIEVGADLEDQVKALRIRDLR